jgi:hypothetical protein
VAAGRDFSNCDGLRDLCTEARPPRSGDCLQYEQDRALEYLPRIGIFILMCAVAATTRNLRFHALFVFAALVYETSFFGRYYAMLN